MFAAIRLKVKGWKTIIAQAVVGLPAASFYLYTEFSTIDVTPLIPAKYVALFLVGNAILGVVLRIWATTGPVGDKGELRPARAD